MRLEELNEAASDKEKVQAFIKKIYDSAYPNPLGKGAIFSFRRRSDKEEFMVSVELSNFNGMAHISEIVVLEGKTGMGAGDIVMKRITDKADEDDITMHLIAKPIEVAGKKVPKNKIVSFYKKHGFTGAANSMIRKPK